MTVDLEQSIADQMQDPSFATAYRAAQSRYALIADLVARRKAAGLTQDQVAARMGTTQAAVSKIELQVEDTRLSTLTRYAAAVGVGLGVVDMEAEGISDDAG